MSSRRRRKTSRTRRLGGTEAQQRQAAEASAKFWHGGIPGPTGDEHSGHAADASAGAAADAVAKPEGVQVPAGTPRISVTPDPTSTVRSLGKPPLVGREMVAEHYFEAVYQRAVAMAGALAAAGDLLDDSDGTFTSS